MNKQPRNLLILAFFMLLFGAAMPMLIIIGLVESTFFTNFASYIISVGGLFLALLTIAMYVGENLRDTPPKEDPREQWFDEWDEDQPDK